MSDNSIEIKTNKKTFKLTPPRFLTKEQFIEELRVEFDHFRNGKEALNKAIETFAGIMKSDVAFTSMNDFLNLEDNLKNMLISTKKINKALKDRARSRLREINKGDK